MSKGIICMQPPYINFVKYYEVLYRWRRRYEQNSHHFQNVEDNYFMQPLYINFLRYHDKFFIVVIVMMSRILTTFQNVEVYYFYAAAMY